MDWLCNSLLHLLDIFGSYAIDVLLKITIISVWKKYLVTFGSFGHQGAGGGGHLLLFVFL